MPQRRIAWLALAVGAAAVMAFQGCAPRYLEKTPYSALRYPHLLVDPQELANAKALVAINPKDPQAARAYYLIAQDAFNRQAWDEAYKDFQRVYKKHARSEWAAPAGMMMARTRSRQNRPLDALALLQGLRASPDKLVVQETESVAATIINDELSLADLSKARTLYADSEWGQRALFVLGKRYLDSGQPGEATTQFETLQRLYPQSIFLSMALELIAKATRLVPVDRNRIGCLLPLTGPFAPYGKTLLQGLELALAECNNQRGEGEKLGLVTADSLGTTIGAVAGLKRLAEVDKVMVVIGPALSSSARALIPEFTQYRLTVISPSAAEPGLAGASPYFFRYMLANEAQGSSMAEYAVLRKGLQRFGILNGEDPYDRSLADAFEAKTKELGAEVVARAEFPRGTTDFKEQMLRLGGVDPGLQKSAEVNERKQLDQSLEKIAYQIADLISPQPEDPTLTPTPTVQKRVAIVRFVEQGQLAQQMEIGRLVTEKFSYALAPKFGLHVLTQKETFQGLEDAGLSLPALEEPSEGDRLAAGLGVDYVVLGRVVQVEESTVPMPGQPIPIKYRIMLQLYKARGGVLREYSAEWIKSMPPGVNVKNVEAVYLPIPAGDAIQAASQLGFYDIQAAVLGCDAWLTPMLLRRGADVLEGAVLATGFWLEDDAPRVQQFIRQYETMFSARPTLLAAQAYDALYLADAVLRRLPRTANADREDFKRELQKMKGFNGVTGLSAVEPNGEIQRKPLFLEIRNGQLKKVP